MRFETGYRDPVGIRFAYGLFVARRREACDLAYADFTISAGYDNFCPIETDCHLHDRAVVVHGVDGGDLLVGVDHLGVLGGNSLQAIPSKAVRIL